MLIPAARLLEATRQEFARLLPLLADSGVDGSSAASMAHSLGLLYAREKAGPAFLHAQFAVLSDTLDRIASTVDTAETRALIQQSEEMISLADLEALWIRTLASAQAAVRSTMARNLPAEQRLALIATLVEWETADRERQLATPLGAIEDSATEITVDRLTAYLRDRFDEATLTVTKVQPLSGGFGKQTTIFAVEGQALSGEFVIRRDIGDNAGLDTSCHLIHREYPVIRAAFERGFPAPDALWLDTEHELLPGGHFIVMRRAPGNVAGSFFGAQTSIPDDLSDILADRMAQLHAIESLRELGDLTDTIRSDLWDLPLRDCVEHYIRNWFEFYLREQHTPSPALVALYGWLLDNIPDSEGTPRLIHGDIGFHNFLLHEGRMSALVDWEFAHIGDPAEELGYVKMTVGQSLDWDRFIARYRAAGGKEVSAETLRFYGVWAYVRNASGANILSTRLVSGLADDLKLSILPFLHVPPFLKNARALIEQPLD
ncbi:phosphotransferase family protein [Sphingobium sp.]|uniref:phosphotransferase family protein n=1 Tax=Sphingobium sp. TaxID=1912891 RepID=UPI0028BF4D5B|nr:phosphotransferase family protein [Sphingobium sp.]